MQPIRVALVQLGWPGDRASIMSDYRRLIAEAVEGGAALVCLPEFSLSPYFPGTLDPSGFEWAEDIDEGESHRFFSEMAQTHKTYLIGSLFEQAAEKEYYDTAVLYGPDGKRLGRTRKVHIPAGDGYHENHFFQGYHEYPVHDLTALGGLQVAAPTCYDQWFPELARIYTMNGANFIFYPTAIGSEPNAPDFDSQPQWEIMMRSHAIANGVFIAAANRIGQENGVTFYGSSFICDPMGNILAQASRDKAEVISAALDLTQIMQWRTLFPLVHQRKPHTYGRLLESKVEAPVPEWLAEIQAAEREHIKLPG